MGDRARFMSTVTVLRHDPATLVQRARAGLEVLTSHPGISWQVVAVGHCLEGLAVL